MRAGQLRHTIKIETSYREGEELHQDALGTLPEAQDEYGQPVTDWQTYAIVAARKQDLSGTELFSAQQIHSSVTTLFVIRHRTDVVLARMRVNHDGTIYDIHHIQEDPRGRELHLICSRES